ncbi:helix-turn-helix domain-containing protein [Allokutzneria sp. NRRL B-24872]|uniref:helix-turn-helix domain-containing protein n=1 Tax=Allokutzneria sp. NRRL B-24872 TaxID=1137961 RepID=UPI00143DF01B|nr:helix-turn-helix transcriptional regulator [Allokutzneria sp. NRRL B-24872]
MIISARSFRELLDEVCEERRTAAGRSFSNVALAERTGFTHSYIAALRRGRTKPSYITVIALAEALDVHPRFFVGGPRERVPAASLPRRPFAEKLNVLFALVHPPGRPEMTTDAIVTRVRDRGRELDDPLWTISPSTVVDLRSGKTTNPPMRHVVALAEAFGTEPRYFFDDAFAAELEEQLARHHTLNQLGVNALILRAADQPREIRDDILKALVSALRPSSQVEIAVQAALDQRPSSADHGQDALDECGKASDEDTAEETR